MYNTMKSSLVITIALSNLIMIILDVIWISLNASSYAYHTQTIQLHAMKVWILPAVVAYLLLAVAVVLCILENRNVWWHNTLYGGAWGFIIYGVYNATNLAIFSKYSPILAIKDTLWGTVLFASTLTAAHFIRYYFDRRWS